MPRLLAAALCLLSLTTFAQAQKPAPQKKPPVVQRVEFDPDLIGGGIAGPDGLIFVEPPAPVFPSLLKVRDNFNKELLESVHSL